MIDWRIYYEDGSTFDSSQGAPEDAPAFGVICIVETDPTVGRYIWHRNAFYYYSAGRWFGGDRFDVIMRLLHREPIQALFEGRMTLREVYLSTYKRADQDPDFKSKSGYRSGEKVTNGQAVNL